MSSSTRRLATWPSKVRALALVAALPVVASGVPRDHIAGIRGGRGGFWEDLGYEWYTGI